MRFTLRVSVKATRAAVVAGCALTLVACGGGDQPEAAPEGETQVQAPAQAPETTSATPSPSRTQEPSESNDARTEATATSSKPRPTGSVTSANGEKQKAIEDARKKFGSLAPDSLFDQFDSCAPNGVQDSVACDGDEVGQFQFYASDAKAASTTQLLTELRSSRVVEDTGTKVVGWSTLGSIAVITVVDNDKGLILQHMVSSDEYDPAERIYELGLADQPASATDEPDADETAKEDA